MKSYSSPARPVLFWLFASLIVCGLLASCDENSPTEIDNSGPKMDIEDGSFSLDAHIISFEDSVQQAVLGSGTVTFRFDGDTTGNFNITGSLRSGQTSPGVAAIIRKILSFDGAGTDETLSLIAMSPTGGERADFFVLANDAGVTVDTLRADAVFGVGPMFAFNVFYLKDLNIAQFWAGDVDIFAVAERSFIMRNGIVTITSRDSTRITGTFSATTLATIDSR